mmetsp:Transcript_4107/g.7902  ORF Transcript_4107/g.7902 Transcript_4107/m.7902 type:complete len:80 (-) Transcript_4107:2620-2859(-)
MTSQMDESSDRKGAIHLFPTPVSGSIFRYLFGLLAPPQLFLALHCSKILLAVVRTVNRRPRMSGVLEPQEEVLRRFHWS